MVYQWKPNTHFPVAAGVAGSILEGIRESHGGRLTADMVVDEARSKKHPLHPVFEWDDDRAAELYRQEQARHMIRSIVVEQMAPVLELSLRAFVSVRQPGDDSLSYTHIQVAMRDEDMTRQLLERAWRELQAWRERYETLRYASEQFETMLAFIEDFTANE